MSVKGATGKEYPEVRTKLGSRGLWTLALVVLALVCLCTLVTTVTMVAGGRDALQGSGTVIAENRPVSHFERVSLRDLGTCIIVEDDEEALTVETDDNLMRYVESRVEGGTLSLGLSGRAKDRGVKPSKGITYWLSVRHVSDLEVADSGRIQAHALDVGSLEIKVHDSGYVAVDSLEADTLQLYIEDSGDAQLAGRVDRQEVTVEDSARYLAGRLQSRKAVVVASDSAEATLWATEALDVTVADSGHVRYYGKPRRTERLSDRGTLAGLGQP